MATVLGRKIIRQIPRSFLAGGTGGNLRLSSGVAGARPKAHNRGAGGTGGNSRLSSGLAGAHAKAGHNSGTANEPFELPGPKYWIASMLGCCCFDYALGGAVQADVIKKIKGYGEGLKKMMVRKEVSRLLCEENIPQLEQNREWGAPLKD